MKYNKAEKLIDIYGEAWTRRDPELILSIFTQDAIYNDPKESENQGHDEIHIG